MVQATPNLKQISELIEIFLFFGVKKDQGFFQEFQGVHDGWRCRKNQKLKKSIKYSWSYISAKKRLLFLGEYTSICVTQLGLGEIRFHVISSVVCLRCANNCKRKTIIVKTLEFLKFENLESTCNLYFELFKIKPSAEYICL